jgi:methyl-accepting chemotaxis protein
MQLDQVIQQNAAGAEELSSTAEELSSQAEQLQATVGFFRISSNGGSRHEVRQLTTDNRPVSAAAVYKGHRAAPAVTGLAPVGRNGGSQKAAAAARAAGRDAVDDEFERL